MTRSSLINLPVLVLFTVALAIGQVLFKQVALSMRGRPLLDGLISLAFQPALYLAIAIYGASTLLWIWILSRVSLMQAYPWVSGGMVIVPLLGWYFFGERVAPMFWLGVVLIVAGILLTQYASAAP